MSDASIQQVARYLQHLSLPGRAEGDGVMLQRYAQHRDADAFAYLVDRHGPMVLGVCRRVAGQLADAEDAFQATFLALARQVRSIRDGNTLAAWLQRVAYRTARKARRRSGTAASEAVPSPVAQEDPLADVAWREVRGILDDELSRLSEELRAPLVLCYLDGATRDEAAQRLGWSLGTLKRRLERGRSLLRQRLVTRGLAPALLAVALQGGEGLYAAVPPSLAEGALALAKADDKTIPPTILSLLPTGVHPVNRLLVTSLLATLILVGLAAGSLLTLAGDSAPTRPELPPGSTPALPDPGSGTAKTPRQDRYGDPLPAGALQRFGTERYRHGGGFNSAALSADGKRLVAASEIGVTLFDVATGKILLRLRQSEVPNGFGINTSKVAISPDGKTIVSVASNRTVRVWDAGTGKEIARLGTPMPLLRFGGVVPGRPAPPPGTGPSTISGVRFADQGKAILVYGDQAHLLFFDPHTRAILRQFHLEGIFVGLSPDHKTLLSLTRDKSQVILSEAKTGKAFQRIKGEGFLSLAALSPDGKHLVAANTAEEVFFWELPRGTRIAKHEVRVPEGVRSNDLTVLAVAPDNRTVLAGTRWGTILRWDLSTGKELPALPGHCGDYVTGLFLHPDGRTLVSVGWDGLLRRWDLPSAKPLSIGDGYTDHVHALRSPNGRFIVASDGAGKLDVWDASSGKRLRALRDRGIRLNRLAFSPDGRWLGVGQADDTVSLWETATWREGPALSLGTRLAPGKNTWYSALTFSPDGKHLLISGSEQGTLLWDLAAGKKLWQVSSHGAATFSPDGKTVVVGGWDKTLHFLDPATGKERLAVVAAKDDKQVAVDDIAFTPDGKVLATSHHDGTVRLRDPVSGVEHRRVQVAKDVVWEISFSADGKWLFSAVSDHTLRLHEVMTGQEVLHLAGHDGRVYHGKISPDGRTALSAAWDLTVLLWSLRPAHVPATRGNLDALWNDLRSTNAAVAYRAIWALRDDPARAVSLLQARLKPGQATTERTQILAWIADLDANDFTTREAASAALAKEGTPALPLLRDALGKNLSAEQRLRIKRLLKQLEAPPGAEDWRVMRAVQVLELANTPETRRLLHHWASGPSGMLLTDQATSALARLGLASAATERRKIARPLRPASNQGVPLPPARAPAPPAARKNPRQVVEAYLAAAVAGKVGEASKLARSSPGREKNIRELRTLLAGKTRKLTLVYVGQGREVESLAVSEEITVEGKKAYLVFTLTLTEGSWLINDIDFESKEGVAQEVQRYREKNPRAKKLEERGP